MRNVMLVALGLFLVAVDLAGFVILFGGTGAVLVWLVRSVL